MNERIRPLWAILALLVALLAAPAGAVEPRDSVPPLFDVAVIRPVTLATGIVAAAVYVPLAGIPLSIFGQFDQAAELFEAGPGWAFRRTFLVPLGAIE